jgi:hypothetical protein
VKFSRDPGSGSFGQADLGGPARMAPRAGIYPGGTQAGRPPMQGSHPQGMGPMGPAGVPPTGMPSYGTPPAGASPMGVPPTGMQPPWNQGYGGMGQYPMQPPGPMYGGMTGGTIRNNLGSELKKKGFFQKDGKIQNLRGGFFGGKKPKQPSIPQGGVSPGGVAPGGGGNMGTGPFSFLGNGGGLGGPGMPQARQLILETTQAGIAANGIASISSDNVFSCMANLPSPNVMLGQGYGTYAAYLVDSKGQTGFLAGILRPVGNGVYQTQFRSQVPLAHYSRVIITIENPQQLGHVPRGPIILQVKQPKGPIQFLTPIKNAGGSVWKKLSGLIQGKPKVPVLPESIDSVEIEPPLNVESPVENPPL